MPERYLGRTLGKYRIDAVVGAGGFAWVYKAFDPELEKAEASKRIDRLKEETGR